MYNPTVDLTCVARNDTSRIGTAVVQLSDVICSENDHRDVSDERWQDTRDEFIAAVEAAKVGESLEVPACLLDSLTRQNFLYRVTKIAAEGK